MPARTIPPRGDSSNGTTAAVIDYELMENYQLATAFAAGTEIAVVLNGDGLTEVFTIGGNAANAVIHVQQNAESDTGRSSYALAATASGATITALAACQDSTGCRVVCIGTNDGQVLLLRETAPGSCQWDNTWTPLGRVTQYAQRLALGLMSNDICLAASAALTQYGSTTKFEIAAGMLSWSSGPCTWAPQPLFESASPAIDVLPVAQRVCACVTPTLVVWPATHFVPAGSPEAIWSTEGSGYSSNAPASIWRPLLPDSDSYLLGDSFQTSEASPEGTGSVQIASVIAPAQAQTPMIVPAAEVDRVWDSDHTGTGKAAIFTVADGSGYSGVGWVANDARHSSSFHKGIVTFQNTPEQIGIIRTDILESVQVGAPVWQTDPKHARHPLEVCPVLDASGAPTGNTVTVTKGQTLPETTGFPPPVYEDPSQVILADPSAEAQDTVAPSGGVKAVNSSFCQGNSIYCFAVDPTTSYLYVWASGPSPEWQLVSGDVTFGPWSAATGSTLASIVAPDGIHVFAVGQDNSLYHIGPQPEGATSPWPEPIAIAEGVCGLTLAPAGAAALELYAITLGSPAGLLDLVLGEDGWTRTVVDIDNVSSITGGSLLQITSYTVDISLVDDESAPQSGATLTIGASEPCSAVVNGSATRLLPNAAPVAVQTDVAGRARLVIQTTDLTAPVLTVAPAGTGAQALPVQPNSKVVASFATISSTTLGGLTDASNTPLFQGNYANSTQDIAKALNQVGTIVSGATAHLARPGETTRFTGARPRAGATPAFQPWQLTFSDSGALFSFGPSPDALRQLAADQRRDLPRLRVSPFNEIASDLADVGRWLEDETESLTGCIVEAVETGIQVTMTFYVGLKAWAFATILDVDDLVNDAMDLVATFFARLQVEAERLAEAFSLIFDWTAIAAAKDAVEYAIDTIFAAMGAAVTDLQTKVDDGFSSMQSDIASQFDNIAKTLPATKSIADALGLAPTPSSPIPAVQATLVSGNLHHYSALLTSTPPGDSSLDDMANGFSTAAAKASSSPSVSPPSLSLFTNPDALMETPIQDLLNQVQALIADLVSLVQQAVDTIFEGLEAAIASIRNAIATMPLPIPWIGDLYQAKFGTPMTASGLIGLTLAIPAHVAYTAVTGTAPFPDESAVSEFTSQFTPASVLSIWGILPSGPSPAPMIGVGSAYDRLAIAAGALTLAGSVVNVVLSPALDALAVEAMEPVGALLS
jgi:hypothetical protein